MINYSWEYIQSYPKETRRLLGINYEQLQDLMEYAKLLEKRHKQEQEKQKVRINKAGGGREAKISREEQIILTLIYLRHHLTFQLLGLIFRISKSSANNIFNYWQEILEEALPSSLLEQVKKCEESEEEIQKKLTEYELIVDSEEQEIERSSSYEEQKKHFSGKKRKHTFKNQIIALPKGEDIVDVVAGEAGPKSDIKIWKESREKFDEEQKFSGDKASRRSTNKNTQKETKKWEVNYGRKRKNKEISSERIFVEHVIRIIKIFRVMGERFRLNKEKYESIFLTVCGLVRLRKRSLIINKIKNLETQEIIDILLTHIFSEELSFG